MNRLETCLVLLIQFLESSVCAGPCEILLEIFDFTADFRNARIISSYSKANHRRLQLNGISEIRWKIVGTISQRKLQVMPVRTVFD